MTKEPTFTIGALGDSITTAFNAESSGDNVAYSWATGHHDAGRVTSHFRRLRQALPHLDVRTVNVAVAGAHASALRSQVDRLLPAKPDYVTILIGANDLARWLFGEYGVMLEQLVQDVRSAVERLVAANPRVMILLVSVPDQSRVLNVVLGQAGAGAYLGSLAQSPLLDQIKRAYKERWERVNRAFEEIARRHSANVRFAGGVARAQFAGEHLSVLDKYHPSVEGQSLLAEVTWRDGFFP